MFHADQGDQDVILVSGQSASTFENLIRFINGQEIFTAVDFMYMVLNGERYEMVRLPEKEVKKPTRKETLDALYKDIFNKYKEVFKRLEEND